MLGPRDSQLPWFRKGPRQAIVALGHNTIEQTNDRTRSDRRRAGYASLGLEARVGNIPRYRPLPWHLRERGTGLRSRNQRFPDTRIEAEVHRFDR